jgi:FlaG/FlaF family flagellin (archaellin)
LARKPTTHARAITPILATLLLIVIAVAAIVVTYAWLMTYMSHATNNAGVMLNPAANPYFFGSAHDEISIDVQNTGIADAHLVRIYIGNSTSTMQSQNSSDLPEVCYSHGGIATIEVNYNWTAGATYYFQVVAQEQSAGPWGPYEAPTS